MGKKIKNPDRVITIVWPDGDITTAPTWRELEENMRATQWTTYYSREDFRNEMRRRANIWSGQFPRLSHTPKQFVKSLADTGMFLLIES